jgi:hypothetical protein
MKWLAVLALAGCSGQVGTLSVSLTTAPGSHVLDGVETLRLVLTNPHEVTTAQRRNGGFTIVLDLPATGTTGSLIIDGLDGAGQVVATGTSPPFPIGAITSKLVIYMAAPNTIGAAPAGLTPARSELGVGTLGYGAIFAGGRTAAGTASDAIAIYNAFDHSFVAGMPLPAPRSGLVLAVGANGGVYLFGGRDSAGTTTDVLWRFDTTVAPNGIYSDFGPKPGFARADEIAVPTGSDHYLLSGTPAAELSGLEGKLVARTEVATLPRAGATVTAVDGVTTTLFAGSELGGFTRFRTNTFEPHPLPAAARTGDEVVALPGGKVGVICGVMFPDALRIDAATNAIETFPTIPATARSGCAVVATRRHLIVAGGTLANGSISADADVYDSTTLALVATVPLVVPRTGATAIALPNDQILIAGGVDASGAPIEIVELFTPASLE